MHFYFLYLLFKQIYQIKNLILSCSNIGTANMSENNFAFCRQSLTRLSKNSYQNLKPCLSIDSLRYLLKALNQTILRWKELTQKFKKLHKHSFFKLNVFRISQQPPSLHLLIHKIIFYHNHTIYKLFTVFFITFPFSSFSSLIFLSFLVAVMSEW